MAKLIAIGDSLTQGFQSGAILRTDLAYPALIARSLGLRIPTEFPIPSFPGSGLPLNLEDALRTMERSLGPNIDRMEWAVRFPVLLHQYVDQVENLYERGAGARPVSYGGCYHNLAVWGFRVMDSLTVHSQYSDTAINREEGWIKDDFLGLPSGAMYRTAKRVLNPSANPARAQWTQVDNLRAIVAQDQQLDCLILWLGANDCLGTVLELEVKDMTDSDVQSLEQQGLLQDPETRRRWNLTNLGLFRRDFGQLVETVAPILPAHTQVFVGTVPHVTIPPITRGVGEFDGKYFDYYGNFFANPEDSSGSPIQRRLTKAEVIAIDQRIDGFNRVIREVVAGQGPQWRVVEIGAVLDELAVKRNHSTDSPGLPLINYYKKQGKPDHPLLQLRPVPSVLRLDTQNATRLQGGLFSLDCIHPTAIGYGIIAEVFLTAMQQAGLGDAGPHRLDWNRLISQDSLIQAPPRLWDDIITAAEKNAGLWDLLLGLFT